MDLGPYAVFIVTAYAVTIGIIAALILLVTLERRHLARARQLRSQGDFTPLGTR